MLWALGGACRRRTKGQGQMAAALGNTTGVAVALVRGCGRWGVCLGTDLASKAHLSSCQRQPGSAVLECAVDFCADELRGRGDGRAARLGRRAGLTPLLTFGALLLLQVDFPAFGGWLVPGHQTADNHKATAAGGACRPQAAAAAVTQVGGEAPHLVSFAAADLTGLSSKSGSRAKPRMAATAQQRRFELGSSYSRPCSCRCAPGKTMESQYG